MKFKDMLRWFGRKQKQPDSHERHVELVVRMQRGVGVNQHGGRGKTSASRRKRAKQHRAHESRRRNFQA